MLPANLLERAFILARSGEFASINDLRLRLRAEKYEQVDAHLSAPSLARQLRAICVEAHQARNAEG